MRKVLWKVMCAVVLFAGIGMMLTKQTVQADAVIREEDTTYDRYIAFGKDLSKKEREAVLSGFGISEEDVKQYKTIEITNQEEHDYLGDYISASVIGKRALSSVMVVKTEQGNGITVDTKNISYCTSSMYCNALTTAGLTDAQVTVVGPFSISGTSALVGAMKAYAEMTGKDISETTMDTATDELVTTAELGDALGDKEKAAGLIAAVKQKVFTENLASTEDIEDAVKNAAKALKLDLDSEDVQNITDMMEKVSKENLDIDSITEQAKGIYDKLKDAGIDFSEVNTEGLVTKIGNFFASIFEAIADFFRGLFG